MKKKLPFVISFALAALIVIGQVGFAQGSDNGNSSMMNGNGMTSMMNGNSNGMMKMMNNDNMSKMMDAMNSPEGKKMIQSCTHFMQSFNGTQKKSK